MRPGKYSVYDLDYKSFFGVWRSTCVAELGENARQGRGEWETTEEEVIAILREAAKQFAESHGRSATTILEFTA